MVSQQIALSLYRNNHTRQNDYLYIMPYAYIMSKICPIDQVGT